MFLRTATGSWQNGGYENIRQDNILYVIIAVADFSITGTWSRLPR